MASSRFGGRMRGIFIGGRFVPYYGLMIMTGILAAAFMGRLLIKYRNLDVDKFYLFSIYVAAGGITGAKLLYVLVSFEKIEWSRLTELQYLNQFLGSGFVFYGGVIGGLGALHLASRIHQTDIWPYLVTAIPCLPIAHGFGRIGCFLASCCWGIPYEGWGSVTYEEPCFPPAGVSLFPVQLLEAVLEFLLAAVLIVYIVKAARKEYSLAVYLFFYCSIRFGLEYLRADTAQRGQYGWFSTSQWISLAGILIAAAWLIYDRKCRRRGEVYERGK